MQRVSNKPTSPSSFPLSLPALLSPVVKFHMLSEDYSKVSESILLISKNFSLW